jgi:hypothetical protein
MVVKKKEATPAKAAGVAKEQSREETKKANFAENYGTAKQPTTTTGGSKMDFISVPKDMGGDIRSDITGVGSAQLAKLHWGTSKQQKPKLTLEFTLTEDIAGIDPPTTGEKILEACSLQSQALWKLNGYYKQVMGEDIPSKDYTPEDFQQMIEDAMLGTEWDLDLMIGTDDKNNPRTQVRTANFKG